MDRFAGERTVLKIIQHLEVEDISPTRRMSPLLQELLSSLFEVSSVPKLTKLVCAIGHDGLLRGGEICSGLLVFDHLWSSSQASVTIELKRTKAHRRGGSQLVTLHNYGPLSAVRRLWAHLTNTSFGINQRPWCIQPLLEDILTGRVH